jgi:hypothetical protein
MEVPQSAWNTMFIVSIGAPETTGASPTECEEFR